jgi:hypothetical protein
LLQPHWLLVTFKLKTAPTTVTKITVTFPVGFTIATGTPTVGTTGFPNNPGGGTIIAPPGTLTAATTAASRTIVVSGLTSASLTSTALYGFTIPTGTITNPATAGQYNPTVESDNGGTTVDLTTTPVYIYGSSANQDQIGVSASVAPSFAFQLTSNADTVPQVNTGSISTSPGVNMIVSTNSPLGYTAYVKSNGGGSLTSVNSGGTIASGAFSLTTPNPVTAGTSDYGFVPSTFSQGTHGGSISYDPEYTIGDGAHAGPFNGANFASFVSDSGYTSSDNILLQERVAVSAAVPYATDYTDTLTVVAAGNF